MAIMVNNTNEVKVVRVNKYDFKFVDPGDTVEIDEAAGLKYGLTVVETVPMKSKVGEAVVETKRIKKKSNERKTLIDINGVDDEIADMLLLKYGDIPAIVRAGESGIIKLPGIGKARAKLIIRKLT